MAKTSMCSGSLAMAVTVLPGLATPPEMTNHPAQPPFASHQVL